MARAGIENQKQVRVDMDLSPNDIRNCEFPSQMRGYDKDEVDNVIEQAAAALEAAKQENLKLSTEIDSLKVQLSGLKQFEETIKSAAIDARRNADMTVANAKQEAELILTRAKAEAEKQLAARFRKANEIEEQITKLALTKKSYLSKVRSLIQSHLSLVDDIAQSEDESHKKNDSLQITESAEVTGDRRETVATQPSEGPAIRTEDANALGDSVVGLPESSKVALSEALKNVLGEEKPSPEGKPSIDPELAQALESYQKPSADVESEMPQTSPPPSAAQQPGDIVETSWRAEDIPQGFVAKEADEEMSDTTDKVAMPAAAQDQSARADNPEGDVSAEEKTPPVAPDELADELDRVVAKFEEEMDKAQKQ